MKLTDDGVLMEMVNVSPVKKKTTMRTTLQRSPSVVEENGLDEKIKNNIRDNKINKSFMVKHSVLIS